MKKISETIIKTKIAWRKDVKSNQIASLLKTRSCDKNIFGNLFRPDFRVVEPARLWFCCSQKCRFRRLKQQKSRSRKQKRVEIAVSLSYLRTWAWVISTDKYIWHANGARSRNVSTSSDEQYKNTIPRLSYPKLITTIPRWILNFKKYETFMLPNNVSPFVATKILTWSMKK